MASFHSSFGNSFSRRFFLFYGKSKKEYSIPIFGFLYKKLYNLRETLLPGSTESFDMLNNDISMSVEIAFQAHSNQSWMIS